MLVNTIAGLGATGAMERDLMRSYGAGYAKTFVKVRLPNACRAQSELTGLCTR